MTRTQTGTAVSVTVAALVFVVLIVTGVSILTPADSAKSQSLTGHPVAAAEHFAPPRASVNGTVNVTGYDTTAVSLSWGTPLEVPGAEYEIEESNRSFDGPWISIVNSSPVGLLFVPGFLPGQVVWFRDIYTAIGFPGNITSTPIRVSLATNASLVRTDLGNSVVQLSWTNNAHYGGLIGFQSYQIEERVNESPLFAVATLTNVSDETYSVPGSSDLNAGSVYSFFILTTDICERCGSYLINSTSNSVTITSVPPVAPSGGLSTLDYGIIGVIVAGSAIGVVGIRWRLRGQAPPKLVPPPSGTERPSARP